MSIKNKILRLYHHSERTINPIINARSYYSFLAYVKRCFSYKKQSSIIFIKITNHKDIQMYIGHDSYLSFLKYLSTSLASTAHSNKVLAPVYYLEGCAFAVPIESNNKTKIQKVAEEISKKFNTEILLNDFNIKMDPRICIVRIPIDINNYVYFNHFSKAFEHMLPENASAIWLCDISKTREFKIKNELEAIIDFAISNEFFDMFYQPIYDVEKDRFVSAEALIRLKDENYGYINPETFLPVAESNGDIHKIGTIVIEKVCRFIGQGAFNLLGLDYIEINLSISQFMEANFVDKLLDCMSRYNVSSDSIRLEISENSEEINERLVSESIKRLHKLGIKFVLDDYGIGYSNIQKLISMPVDAIKLDKSFINEIDNIQMRYIIQNTVKMMRQLDKEVIVEGIEKEENIKYFSNIGCKSIQGYYFSKPLPETEFVEFMRKNR